MLLTKNKNKTGFLFFLILLNINYINSSLINAQFSLIVKLLNGNILLINEYDIFKFKLNLKLDISLNNTFQKMISFFCSDILTCFYLINKYIMIIIFDIKPYLKPILSNGKNDELLNFEFNLKLFISSDKKIYFIDNSFYKYPILFCILIYKYNELWYSFKDNIISFVVLYKNLKILNYKNNIFDLKLEEKNFIYNYILFHHLYKNINYSSPTISEISQKSKKIYKLFRKYKYIKILNQDNIIIKYFNNNILPKYNNSYKSDKSLLFKLEMLFFYYNKKVNLRLLSEITKCKTTDQNSLKDKLCIECNTEHGYFPISYDYNYDNSKTYLGKYINKYIDCYNSDTIPKNYYFNQEIKAYEKCFETCESCQGFGDYINNNCDTCINNYIFSPEIPNTKNCVLNCSYYYYYNSLGQYLCTENYHCPLEIIYKIEDKRKCVEDCKLDDTYYYQYNGECLKECPENTKPNIFNKCIDNNIENCTLTIKISKIKSDTLNYNIINEMAINFAKEFSYTNNHISQFLIDNLLILFYKNKSCLSEFSLENSVIDYHECLKKINDNFNISSPLVAIIYRKGKYNNPSTKYAFFNPINGEKLNLSFCENTTIFIKQNISFLYKKEEYNWLTSQNIDIFNLYSSFYTDICFNFKSNNSRDMILGERIIKFYPNISLCDSGCEYKNTNYTSLINTCKCKFNESNYFLINTDPFEDESKYLTQVGFSSILYLIFTMSVNMRITILICYKHFFTFKYFIRNLGGFIIFILIITDIICLALLIRSDYLFKIKKFIFLIIDLYIKYKKKRHYNLIRGLLHTKKKKSKNKAKKGNETSDENMTTSKRKINNRIKEKNKKLQKKSKCNQEKNKNNLSQNNSKNIFEINELESPKKNKRKTSIIDINNINYLKKLFNNKEEFNEKDMKEYLRTSLDDLDFYNVIKKDKRTFWIFLLNRIVKKQMLINTFYIVEETIPKYLKIILFTIYIDLFFFLNTIEYGANDIVSLYYLNDNYFFYFCKHVISKITISFPITVILRNILEFFFVNQKSIKSIIKREKNNELLLKKEINKLIKFIKIRYIIFIIISFIFNLFSWYFISCFNNVYSYSKYEWFLLNITIIILAQILSVVFTFVEACLRYIAIYFKSELVFNLSKYVNLI